MKKILLMLGAVSIALFAHAQDRIITGKVVADDGSTLPGVNVILKGTINGTVTDSDGNYSIGVTPSGGTLVFSFIGLETKEVAIGEGNALNITLNSDVKQLAEVVVTGVGVATDKNPRQ